VQTKTSKPKNEVKNNKAPFLKIAFWGALAIIAVLTAVLTFIAVRNFVVGWEMTSLPGISIQEANPTPDPSGKGAGKNKQPKQPIAEIEPPAWDGAERVTMLVMGLDYRDWEAGEGPPRTDTMVLFTVDPINRSAGMLSIPRDLWVNIPGFNYGRINTAYQLGEAYKLPGGGPQLAAETVEELLGVPVDYYAQIDFGAFVEFIDQIGGIEVVITEEIKIDPLGKGNTKKIKPGKYNLPGDLALAYVRARKTEGGDFDRSRRQQDVILAIRDQIKAHKLLPKLVKNAPQLYEQLSTGIMTNLSLDQAIRLAWLGYQIPVESIKQGSIAADQITFAQSPDGEQDVLKPRTEKIRELRDEIFTQSGPANPIAAGMDPTELVKIESARVAVLNGSSIAGVAASTTDYLKSLGVNIVETGNSEKLVTNTEITFHSGKPYTLQFLVNLMQISPFRIRHFFDLANSADIVIVVGDDWAQNNPP